MSLSLTKAERLQIEVMRQEISPWGLASQVVMGGKHLKLKVWDRAGGVHVLVAACTPRNGDNALTVSRQRARRLIARINAEAGY